MKKAFYQDNPYLDHWKKELDDEAINKHVLNTLLLKQKSIDVILDIGTGSGVQIRRDIMWKDPRMKTCLRQRVSF